MAKYRRRRSFLSQLIAAIRNVLIVLVLLVGGSKLYLYYQVKSGMEQLQTELAPFGELQFADVYTTFTGQVGVTNLSFFPNQELPLAPTVVDEIIVHTPGYLFLLGLEGERMPASMGLTIKGLDSRMSQWFSLGVEQATAGVSGNPFEALACGDIESFETADLQGMGFSRQPSEASLRYLFTGADQFEVHFSQTALNGASTRLKANIQVPNLPAVSNGQAMPQVRVQRFDLELDSATFNRRRNEYCAARIDASVDGFIDAHMQALQSALAQRGLVAEDVVLDQYRDYASGQGRWQILARPVPYIALEELISQPPEAWPNSLEMSGLVGPGQGQIPQAIVIQRVAPPPEQLAEEPVTPEEPEFGIARPSNPWREVVASDLIGLIGQEVKLTMTTGKEYAGRLLDASSDGQLVIDTRLPGGDARVPLPLNQIEKAYVANTGGEAPPSTRSEY